MFVYERELPLKPWNLNDYISDRDGFLKQLYDIYVDLSLIYPMLRFELYTSARESLKALLAGKASASWAHALARITILYDEAAEALGQTVVRRSGMSRMVCDRIPTYWRVVYYFALARLAAYGWYAACRGSDPDAAVRWKKRARADFISYVTLLAHENISFETLNELEAAFMSPLLR